MMDLRYKIVYEGYLFYGDSDGLNVRWAGTWSEVEGLLKAYGEDAITVYDTQYGVTFENGEWN